MPKKRINKINRNPRAEIAKIMRTASQIRILQAQDSVEGSQRIVKELWIVNLIITFMLVCFTYFDRWASVPIWIASLLSWNALRQSRNQLKKDKEIHDFEIVRHTMEHE
jgi:hypothetical protein